MGAAGVTVFEEYIKIFNYTRPISVQTYNLLFARPKELSRLYLFTAPFSTDVCVPVVNIKICNVIYNLFKNVYRHGFV